ncbi:MAG: alanyl-tRNA synthetase [Frankiaceae bacterium]|nr:alanyl-tRNA synthetase [Frankiaceae bacterium]
MESAEIGRRWTQFFTDRGHTPVRSAPLTADDPELLFVVAGMQPFKPYFRGDEVAPWNRAVSIQKCVRTPDIEEVGKTTRHATFFQMAGNFSFGDYFKETAIPLAWELLTTEQHNGGYGFDPQRLWVTVYHDDDEAADLWQRVVGVPADRIQRRGMADNYWSMGVPGPCGPCSEIFYDRGPEHGRDGGPIADEERYLEVWNLVFMQYERGAGGTKDDFPIIGDLPAKNIDTGLGIERTATLLQGVDNLYEIDTTRKILTRAAELTGKRYGADHDSDVGLRVVADHARTAVMLIADGVVPGNEGRGYVLRRIMRRVVRTMRLLGAHDPTMSSLVDASVAAMGPSYEELFTSRARIETVAVNEEESFLATLRTGTTLFDTAAGEVRSSGGRTLGGDKAFQLHDTYGFPIDLTIEMAREQGLEVDEDGFRRLMQEQRDRAKQDAKERKSGRSDLSAYRAMLDAGTTTFTGYSEVVTAATVRGLLLDGVAATAAPEGAEVEVVLDRTPFYAESGGQLADHGVLRLANGALLEVTDTQRPIADIVVHRAVVRSGEAVAGQQAEAIVDVERRRAISRAHTATHLVHTAIRRALGDTATQAGSENGPGRFRFDFHAAGGVPGSVLADVEAEVNAVLLDDLEVRAFVTTQDEARRLGALALFGEKYGEAVRVVEVGEYARELCGGTHAARSGQLGVVKLLHESSIGAGVRRVEALVGADAYQFLARESVLVSQLADLVKAPREELAERVGLAIGRLRDAEKELAKLRAGAVLEAGAELAAGAADVNGVAVVTTTVAAGTTAEDLRRLAADVRLRLGADRPSVVAVAAVTDERPLIVVACSAAAQGHGLKAGELVREAARVLGGGGGGKDDVAQGGGTRADAVDDALRAVSARVAQIG